MRRHNLPLIWGQIQVEPPVLTFYLLLLHTAVTAIVLGFQGSPPTHPNKAEC